MDDIVDSFIIEDELPEPRKRRTPATAGFGGHVESAKVPSGTPDTDVLDGCSILIACNLPVHAGLWLGQYANLLAREDGPLAIIRFSGNTCDIEVFAENIASPEFSENPGDALFEVTTWLSTAVGRVLIVPSPIDRDADLLASGLPLQLVTGTDSTAVVGTYQRAKGLFMACQNAHQPAPAVGLVMVGSEPGVGQKAAAKIQNCASRFLDAEISLDAIVHRMDVMGSRECITIEGEAAFEISDLIAAIRRSASTSEDSSPKPTYIEGSALQVIDRDEYAELESVFDQAVNAEPVADDAVGDVNGAIDSLDAALEREATERDRVLPPAVEYGDDQIHPSDEHGVPTDLLSFMPELRPLPIHDIENLIEPGVAYGVDDRQRLHLVLFGADVTALAVAEKRLESTSSQTMLNAVLETTEIGRLEPFAGGGLQRDILLPESEASVAGLLHRGRYNVHLLVESESGTRRLNLD